MFLTCNFDSSPSHRLFQYHQEYPSSNVQVLCTKIHLQSMGPLQRLVKTTKHWTLSERTFPVAAVNLHPHADGLRVVAEWNEPQSSGDHRRIDLSQLGNVRVHVSLEDLKYPKTQVQFSFEQTMKLWSQTAKAKLCSSLIKVHGQSESHFTKPPLGYLKEREDVFFGKKADINSNLSSVYWHFGWTTGARNGVVVDRSDTVEKPQAG